MYDDPGLAARIAEHDGIDGVATLFHAWVHGRRTSYWTIEGATRRAMPVYRLCRHDAATCAPIDHPIVAGHLPGDEGYAHYGQIHDVAVPEGWDGQVGSVEEALTLADELGVPPARARSELWHCPIAALEAGVEVAPGVTVAPARRVFVGGREARCFDFSAGTPNRSVLPSGELFVRHVYVLRREDEALPLVEAARGADLDGDGELRSSNNVFGVGLEDDDYTPLWAMVPVTVPAGLPSIEASPAYTAATDMFDVAPDYTITPREGRIVDHEITSVLIDCPLQSAPGSL
ncbi:MAG: hypothetical protein KF729_31705 [Sandaracinaceae bacterium]|nr:hypothetical protein [Sandaracinaceae bacterium]